MYAVMASYSAHVLTKWECYMYHRSTTSGQGPAADVSVEEEAGTINNEKEAAGSAGAQSSTVMASRQVLVSTHPPLSHMRGARMWSTVEQLILMLEGMSLEPRIPARVYKEWRDAACQGAQRMPRGTVGEPVGKGLLCRGADPGTSQRWQVLPSRMCTGAV